MSWLDLTLGRRLHCQAVSPRELVARIGALLRRSTGRSCTTGNNLAFDNLILDLESRCVIQRDRQVEVSPMEFRLLKYLMQNAGNVVSKEDLLPRCVGICCLFRGYEPDRGDYPAPAPKGGIRIHRARVNIQTVWGCRLPFW